jgi:hypothetical protein
VLALLLLLLRLLLLPSRYCPLWCAPLMGPCLSLVASDADGGWHGSLEQASAVAARHRDEFPAGGTSSARTGQPNGGGSQASSMRTKRVL